MRDVLKVGETEAKPGEIVKGCLGSVEIADSSKVTIPLININGAEDGPVLTVVSGVHGRELSGIGALLAAIKEIGPVSMRGALLGIPGANPLAIRAGVYKTPVDEVNLSGPWFLPPLEQEKASITYRMACCINEALEKADYVLDMHANGLPSMPFVLTCLGLCQNDKVKKETERIAEAFGLTVINSSSKQVRNIMTACVNQGKPAIEIEMAGNIYLWKSIYSVGSRGILNVMKAIGMLDGDLEKQDVNVIPGELEQWGFLYAQRGGLMFVKKEPGEWITKGETVIEIVNTYGDVVEEVVMPVDGFCRSFRSGFHGTNAVSEGERLAYVVIDRGSKSE